jgi:hypothetical protein
MITIETIQNCQVFAELQSVAKELNTVHEAGIKVVGISKDKLRNSIVDWIEANLVNVAEIEEEIEEVKELEVTEEIEEEIETDSELEIESTNRGTVTVDHPIDMGDMEVNVTPDKKYQVVVYRCDPDTIRLVDTECNPIATIPANVWESLGVKTKTISYGEWIEFNTPIHVPTTEEWLESKGLNLWFDTNLVNMDCRIFTDTEKYYAINKDGAIMSTMDAAFFNPKWFKSQPWDLWLGIEKKARKSGSSGAPGSRVNNPNAKTPKVPQKLIDFMREQPRTVAEMQELMGWSYHNARNHLSYIKWNGLTLVSEGKGETRTHQIID